MSDLICRFDGKKVTKRELRENGDMCDECRSNFEKRYGYDMSAAEWENWFESFEKQWSTSYQQVDPEAE